MHHLPLKCVNLIIDSTPDCGRSVRSCVGLFIRPQSINITVSYRF